MSTFRKTGSFDRCQLAVEDSGVYAGSRQWLWNDPNLDISVRTFRASDAEATARIYFDAVRLGTHDHYTELQRQAWAPRIPERNAWCDRLNSLTTLVADFEGTAVGFMTMTPGGHIDLAFVAPEFIGKGVAKQLYDCILDEAKVQDVTRLSTEASLLARPFFERLGWSVVKQQTVRRQGVSLVNFVMVKDLSS